MRNRRRVVLAFTGAALLVSIAYLGHQPRYVGMGAVANGPGGRTRGGYVIAWETQWRGDRWTGLEEARDVNYGRPSRWRSIGWHPLEVLLRE